MGLLAVACGVLIAAFGLLTTRHAPNDAQFGIEITCLVGGLVLIFLGLTLRRLDRLARSLGGPPSAPSDAPSRAAPAEAAPPHVAPPDAASPGA